tara:strand:+ start:215 stop:517 length:303 start_codon:yes stop_codon:yes gene_type:complete
MDDEFEIIDKSKTICPICMDKQGKYKILLDCGHSIHPLCLKQWINDNYDYNNDDIWCPSCKKNINNTIKKEKLYCSICKKNENKFKIKILRDKYICIDCL